MKHLIQQIIKFSMVGITAFVIDYGLMVLLTEVFAVDYLLSATISFTVSVIFNYVASMRYVFRHKEGLSRKKEFTIFVVLSVIGLVINDACMWLFTEVFFIDYRLSKLIACLLVSIYNFITRKVFLDAGETNEEAVLEEEPELSV